MTTKTCLMSLILKTAKNIEQSGEQSASNILRQLITKLHHKIIELFM